MSVPSNRSLLGKAWNSLVQKGPAGLGRDVRDYLRWRMSQGNGAAGEPPLENLSNWDLNQQELRTLPDVLRSKPILVYAEASTRCNLHCFMCRLSFPETTRRVRQHMTLETFARLEPLFEPGGRLSLFGLGEPLMNPHFLEMLRIAKERGVFVGLNSNAMLLTEPVARAMVELEQDLLMISFSGGTRETYERVITGASYERVIANLRRLNEIKLSAPSAQQSAAPGIERIKPVLELQYTAMRDNLREIPEAVRLAIDLRCAGMVVMPLTIVDPSLAEQSLLNPELWPLVEAAFTEARAVADTAPYPFDLQLPTAELARAMARRGDGGTRRALTPTLSQGERGRGGEPSTQRPALSAQHSALSTQHPEARTGHSALRTQHSSPICHEPWQTFYVRDDGTVNSCCYSNRILGDLKEQTALEVWNGELYRRFRARMRSEDKPSECRVCHKLRGDDWYDQRVDEETFYEEL